MSADLPEVGPLSQVLRPYNPASWFHPVGIRKVLAKLEPRLPDVTGMLFLTFTFNPALFADPSLAFETGRDRLRRVFFKLRHGVEWKGKTYLIDAPYCVKVEFHANGWAHFHAVFLTRRYVPGDLLNALWELGRTNVGRIRNKTFRYLLKYVTKGCDLPAWVLGRNRLRVFQSSRGFYRPSTETPAEEKPSESPGCKRRQTTLGERLESWRVSALLQHRDEFRRITLGAPFMELLADLILPVALDRRYLGNGHVIINDSHQLLPWIIQKSKSAPADSMCAA